MPVTVNCDGVSKKFCSLSSAARYMHVSLPTIRYAYFKKRDTMRNMKENLKFSM